MRHKIEILLLLTVALFCLPSGLAGANLLPPPQITGVSPNPLPTTNGAQALTISGSGFVAGCRVVLRDLVSGQMFINRGGFTVNSTNIVISAGFGTAVHTWSVEVINPDGQSSGQFGFGVGVPPIITRVSPNPLPTTNGPQALTISGSNFVAGCRVILRDRINGQMFNNRGDFSLSSTNIVIMGNFGTAVHTWSVEVINPNGQSSGQVWFGVGIPPAITGVTPNPVPTTNGVQFFSIIGSNFLAGSRVILRDLITGQVFDNRTGFSISNTNIVIPGNFSIALHTWSVEVIAPNGLTSGQFPFSVAVPPVITGVTPNPVPGSNAVQSFTILGSSFVSGGTVTLRKGSVTYTNRPISLFSTTIITISQNFGTNAATWSVEVINPNGQSSGQFSFGVTAPVSTNTFGRAEQISAAKTFDRPRLTSLRQGAHLVFSWPTNSAGFILETATNLSDKNWQPVQPAPAVVDGQFILTNHPESGLLFYRLRN